jgi:indolepyruvate ferredoxin oxidoreductase beta subunit
VSAREAPERATRQQILVSGVGGQGVLFITRLLADAAIAGGHPVLTSETHGMAQRGGIVVSHLKVGAFESPLIRAGAADGLVALREENLSAHRRFLAPSGWAVVGSKSFRGDGFPFPVHVVDAEGIARDAGNPQGANLVLVGFILSRLGSSRDGGLLFCPDDAVKEAISRRFGGREKLLEASLAALDLGIERGRS